MDFILETAAECGEACLWIGILFIAYIKNKWCTKTNKYGKIFKR